MDKNCQVLRENDLAAENGANGRGRTDDLRFTNPVWLVWLRSLPCGKTLLLSGFLRNV